MKAPTTQPFTLYAPLRGDQNAGNMNRLFDQLLRAQDKGLREQSANGLLAPKFSLNLQPLPPGSKPQGSIEQWSGFSGGITRPALLHITPNVVRSPSGPYMLHQDTPRIVPEGIDGVGEVRHDLIDDRPKQK